jgi:chorismate synthase
MKPIATLRQPLPSIDLATGAAAEAGYERSDVCAVSACALVAEAMVAIVLCDALLERIGGESVAEFDARLAAFLAACRQVGQPPTA